jgi:hypothetical protein
MHVEVNVFHYSAITQHAKDKTVAVSALSLSSMPSMEVTHKAISYSAAISACKKAASALSFQHA